MGNAEALQSVVVGFLIPAYSDPVAGTHTFDDMESFNKVRTGYACAFCLAEFRHYIATCPVCGNERDVARDMGETPELWQASHDEYNGPSTGRTVAPSIAETLGALRRDAEVEQIPLKALRQSKRRPGGTG